MTEKKTTRILVEKGRKQWRARRKYLEFAKLPAADKLINDLERHSHIFVLACLMDRQVKAEVAWRLPYLLGKRAGGCSFGRFKKLTVGQVRRHMAKPNPLHRFIKDMAGIFHEGIQRIAEEYKGKAYRIWEGKLSSAEIVYRFTEFKGAGPKIATMAANILARQFKVRMKDYHSIDISPDVHVRRVMWRLGLTPKDASNDMLIYKARALHPGFPGIIDYPLWEIGKAWCKARRQECEACYLEGLCPSAGCP
jgi:endonuclease III